MDQLYAVVVETYRLTVEEAGVRAVPATRRRVLASWEWTRPEASDALAAAEAEAWADELDQLRALLGPVADQCWTRAWAIVSEQAAEGAAAEDQVWPLAVALAYSQAAELGHSVDQLLVVTRLAPVALAI